MAKKQEPKKLDIRGFEMSCGELAEWIMENTVRIEWRSKLARSVLEGTQLKNGNFVIVERFDNEGFEVWIPSPSGCQETYRILSGEMKRDMV